LGGKRRVGRREDVGGVGLQGWVALGGWTSWYLISESIIACWAALYSVLT